MVETDTKTSPLMEYFESLGYNSDETNGKKIIKNYTDTEKEINSLYNGVGIRDISHYGLIELKGVDVLDFIHRVSTNVAKDLPKEHVTDTIFTTEKGRIIDKTRLLNFDEFKLLICSHVNQPKIFSWINKYIIGDDVKQVNINGKYTLFELIGPQVDSFITLICGNVVNNIQVNTFKIINAEGIIFFLVKLQDRFENLKYWIIADPNNGKQLVKYMTANHGIFDFNLIGEESYNSYRVERGIPEAQNEINDQYNPHELRMTNLISFTKGCYIGQEVIARLDTYDKVQKLLMSVHFTEPVDDNETFNLFDEEGREAGTITSSAYSLKCKKYLGLGFIKRTYAEEGKELTAKNEAKNLKVIVKNLPSKK